MFPNFNRAHICTPSLQPSPTFQEEDLGSKETNQLWLNQVHMSHLPECCQGDGNKVLQQIESTLDMDQDNLMQSLQPDALLDKKLPFALKMNQAMRVN